MCRKVSIVVPAWNEEHTIGVTLEALHKAREQNAWWDELIVVDDGSKDDTQVIAARWANKVIAHESNRGKGAALLTGCREASHPNILLLDADLGESAMLANQLLPPLIEQRAQMVIAIFPKSQTKAGFGFVKGLAVYGIYRLSGYKTMAPLSGQRAVHQSVIEKLGHLSHRFGVEVGLTIDAVRNGFTICEVEVPFQHRETGRDLTGFLHRGKQFVAVGQVLLDKWLHPSC